MQRQGDPSVLTILDQLSTAYGKQGRFRQACDLAELMISFVPHDSAGYLRLASLQMMQGKSADAVKILNKALDSISDKELKYAVVRDARDKATEQTAICVDFIAKLPSEIVVMVMELVNFKDRIVCATVSKVWRHVLVCQSPKTWSKVRVDSSCKDGLMWHIIAAVLRHSKTLYMEALSSVRTSVLFSGNKLITENCFKNVQSLALHDCDISYSLGLVALSHMPSLKILLIESKGEPILPLGELLIACPNLISLTHSHDQSTSWPAMGKGMSLPDVLKLESLAIMDKTIDQSEINKIVKRSRFLRNLYVMVSDFTIFECVRMSCPDINVLAINIDKRWFVEKKRFVRTPSEDGFSGAHERSGLSTLFNACSGPDILLSQQIMPLIKKNENSLRDLFLMQTSPHSSIERLTSLPLGRLVASNLTRISLRRFPGDSKQEVNSLLQRCPCLSFLLVDDSRILDTPEIFNTLALADALKSLCIYKTSVHAVGFKNFLRHHIDHGEKSSLKIISLQQTFGVDDDTLEKLGSLNYMHEISVVSCPGVNGLGLVKLANGLAKASSTLTYLKLGDLQGLDDSYIPRIVRIQSLRTVALGSCFSESNGVGDDSIAQLLRREPRLQLLIIERCPRITKSIWKSLSESRVVTTKIHFA